MSSKKSRNKTKTYEVEKIVKKRIVDNKPQYLIKWVGFDDSQNTWEPEEHILDKNLIQEYEEANDTSRPSSAEPKGSPKTPVKHKSLQIKTSDSSSKHASPKPSASKRMKTEVASSPAKTPLAPEPPAAALAHDLGDDGEVRILGAKPDKGVIMFLVEFPDTKRLQFVESTVANKKYPQQVIKFYEARLDWLAEEAIN